MQANILLNNLPSAHEIEMRVISALTQLGDAKLFRLQKAMLQLNEECFYTMDHKKLFRIIEELFKQEKDFSFVSFMTYVPVELQDYLYKAVNTMYYTTNYLETDIQELIDYRTWREYLSLIEQAKYGSISDCVTVQDSLKYMLEKIKCIGQFTSNQRQSVLRTYEAIADEYLTTNAVDTSEFIVNIPNLPPVPNRALITIAGRSGHGKTFFALYLMDKIIDAKPEKTALYFNLEMHETAMLERHAMLLGYNGYSRMDTIKASLSELLTKKVAMISIPMITIDEIETHARLLSMTTPLSVIVVDYLGLVRSKTKAERNDLVQIDIAKRLAALSIELDCTVIGLIQVNRDFKTRPVGERCPRVEDSAESMGAVHSASWWIGIDQPCKDTDNPEYENLFVAECRKSRSDGQLFSLKFTFANGLFSPWFRAFSPMRRNESPEGF